ncbi:hypothetical protein ACFWA9_19470 [Kitasatospora sp. NPDC059973]|uniref:hypothetical protein n=1 Tax=Kitasatospora sp. NPDC059973 TaxID=3347020 RepID=UPI0036AE07DF
MPETTPQGNFFGPAKVQMSPEQMANLGRIPGPEATAPAEPTLVPADQVKPEDIAALSIEYRGSQPVIVARGGKYIPAGLPVEDESGNPFGGSAPAYGSYRWPVRLGDREEVSDGLIGYFQGDHHDTDNQ